MCHVSTSAQAQHFAAELVVRYKHNRIALPCIALTADSAILTACANDFGYEYVFSRQVEAYGDIGDVLICLTTSGNSPNIKRAAKAAEARSIEVIYLDTGPANEAQESHLHTLHEWAEQIENAFIN
jgi:D-sedoheptulose 7-phosphate isomerase